MLASAIRDLASRCAQEGWQEQAQVLFHEAQVLTHPPVTDNNVRDRIGVSGASKATLTVTNLGRFQIDRNERPLSSCHSARAIWVLRYLLGSPHLMAHKGELATQLWPNAPGERAYHSLHVAISALRDFLDDTSSSVIMFSNDCYMFRDDVIVKQDSDRFQSLVFEGRQLARDGQTGPAEAVLDTAISLYAGDFDVAGLDFEWAMVEQRKHAATYLEALDESGSIAFDQERFGQAIYRFRRLLLRDPYREDILAKLMIAFSRLGRRGDAAREYARCAYLLSQELGVEPSNELKGVYRSLLGVDPPLITNETGNPLHRRPLQPQFTPKSFDGDHIVEA
jgi:DNA-binding SARP family transcriptional activator